MRLCYSIAHRLLGVLPVDRAGRRVFDETLADWRKEADVADSRLRRATTVVRGFASVARSVLMVSARDVTSREGATALFRLALWSTLSVLLFVALNWNQSVEVEGALVAVSPVAAWLLSVLQIATFMPLLAFVSQAWARRYLRQAPRLGPAMAVSVVMLVMMGWVVPAAGQAYRELIFGLTSGRGTLPPGLDELSVVALIQLIATDGSPRAVSVLSLRLLFVVAVPVMLALGMVVRGLAGWRRAAGSVLPLLVLGLPFLLSIVPPFLTGSMWLAFLASVLATRSLASGGQPRATTAGGNPPAFPTVGQ